MLHEKKILVATVGVDSTFVSDWEFQNNLRAI